MKIIMKTLMMLALVLALISGCGVSNVANPTETIPGPQVTTPVEDTSSPTTPSVEVDDPTDETTVPSETVPDPTIPSEEDDVTTQPTEPSDDPASTEPTTPTKPSEPTAPTVPSEPTKPTVPCVPTQPTTPPVTDYTLKLSKQTLSLVVGKSETLTCTYTGDKTLTWKSSNTSVATVSNGKVTAKKVGTVTIAVTDGAKQVECIVTVKDYTLELNRGSLQLTVGDVGNLTCTYTGSDTLTWGSSNPSVATVSKGKVTAKAAGDTIITVTDGVKKSQCAVTVKDKIAISPSTLTITVGKVGNLTYTYTGSKTLTWKTSNSSVATVSNGKVTAKAAGTAVITLTDGVVSAKCNVTVTAATPNTDDNYTLKVSPTTLTLEVGNTQTLKVEYGGKGTLSWNSSNTDVATVSSKGKVTAKAAGTAVITVTDGVKKSQCAVTVKAAAVAASLTINTPKNTTIFVGETLKLDYTYTGTGKLTFESADTSRLTIDNNGKMTGVSEGGVYVSVNGPDVGRKNVRIVVKSKANAATSINMSTMEGPLFDGVTKHVGNYMSFMAYSKPDENPITVTTSNADIVSVDSKVVNTIYSKITLKFKAAGSATITLTSEDGNVVYKYKVNVKSEYSCYPGKEKLTPEEFANACTQVMVENGFTYSTGCTSYRVWTVSPNELKWTNAKANAQGCVRSWYPNGCNKCWISYEGTDENGNYVFYTRWA